MKRALIIVLLLTFLFWGVGCDPGWNYLYKDELVENTVKIQLFDYENETPKILRLSGNKKPHFDFNKTNLIDTLDEAYFDNVLNDVSGYRYLDFGTALNEPMGKTLVLYQSNGNMIVLFGCAYTTAKGENFYYGDCYVFNEIGVFVEYIGELNYLFVDEIAATYFQNNP